MSCGHDLQPVGRADPVAPPPSIAPAGPADAVVSETVIERFEIGSYLKHAAVLWVVFVASCLAVVWTLGSAVDVAVVGAIGLVGIIVVVLLPLARMGIGARLGIGWRLRFRHPVCWHAGPHELVSVSPPSALAMGLLAGLVPGLFGGCLVAFIAVVGASRWPGLGALLLGLFLGPPLWLGLEGFLLSATYDLLARAWGGVRFWSGNHTPSPEHLAEPAPGGPIRATVVSKDNYVLPFTFAGGCEGCLVQMVFAPVFLLGWVILRLGIALLGGTRVEVR
jgi:hypothetical protein